MSESPTPIEPFHTEKSPRCGALLPNGARCPMHKNHIQPCRPAPAILPPLTRDPMSQPYDPKRR